MKNNGLIASVVMAAIFSFMLTSCSTGDGNLGANGGNGASQEEQNVDHAPRDFALVEASTAFATRVTASWIAPVDDRTPEERMKYRVLIGAKPGFSPASALISKEISGKTHANIEGLDASTEYYIRVTAIDEGGNSSSSNELPFKTAPSDPVLKDGVRVVDADQISKKAPTISEEEVRYSEVDEEALPSTGDYLYLPTEDGGVLRRVVEVKTTASEGAVLSTEDASVADVFDEFDFSIDSKSIPIFPSKVSKRSAGASGARVARTRQGFIMADLSNSVEAGSSPLARTRAAAGSASDNPERIAYLNEVFKVSAPSSANFAVGKSNTLEVRIAWASNKINKEINPNTGEWMICPDSSLQLPETDDSSKKNYEICPNQFRSRIIRVARITPEKGMQELDLKGKNIFITSTSGAKQTSGAPLYDGILLQWTPQPDDFDVDMNPYIAQIEVVAARPHFIKGLVAVLDRIEWEVKKETIEIPFYVSRGDGGFPVSEKSSFEIPDSKGKFEGAAQYSFAPSVSVQTKVSKGRLESAKVSMKGVFDFDASMLIEAVGAASLNTAQDGGPVHKKTILKRSYTVITATTPPVVITGTISLDAYAQAEAYAAFRVEQKFGYTNTIEVGLECTGGCNEDSDFKPIRKNNNKITYTLDGKLTGGARVTFTVEPKLEVRVYKYPYAALKVVPRLDGIIEGEVDFHSERSSNNNTGTRLDDISAELKRLEVGFQAAAGLRFAITPWKLIEDGKKKKKEDWVGWPSKDPGDFKMFTLLERKKIYGLPLLTAYVRERDRDHSDSRAIHVVATATDIDNPFYPFSAKRSLNPFVRNEGRWLVSTVDGEGHMEYRPYQPMDTAWLLPKKPGKYKVRFEGHSSLSRLALQKAEVEIDYTDKDGDGLPELWLEKYPELKPGGAKGDYDNDGISNLDEFRKGTDPTKKDEPGQGDSSGNGSGGDTSGGASSTTVTRFSPSVGTVGVKQLYTITGKNLPGTITVSMAGGDCAKPFDVTAVSAKVYCTPKRKGRLEVRLLDKPNGVDIKGSLMGGKPRFSIDVGAASTSAVTSVAPLDVQVGKKTFFTVKGNNIPRSVAIRIVGGNCGKPYAVTANSAKVACTMDKAGKYGVEILDKTGGTPLAGTMDRGKPRYMVTVAAAPEVTGFAPTKGEVGKKTFFTVKGTSLPSTIAIGIDGAECGKPYAITATSARVACTPHAPGSRNVYIADKPGGKPLPGSQVGGKSRFKVTVPEPVADAFDYPIGDRGIEGGKKRPVLEYINPEQNIPYAKFTGIGNNHHRGGAAGAGRWYNLSDVGNYVGKSGGVSLGGLHPGEDWNYGLAGQDDGMPVYAVANGKVLAIKPAFGNDYRRAAWAVVLEHTLPDGKHVYSLYLHVTSASQDNGAVVSKADAFTIKQGQWVKKGDMIARLARHGDMTQIGGAHLHFEMRAKLAGGVADLYKYDNGKGYYTPGKQVLASSMSAKQVKEAMAIMKNDEGILDPSDFIDAHRGGGVVDIDADNDGLPDAWEKAHGLNSANGDSDGDGVADSQEVGADLDHPKDTDGDGKIDAIESAKLDADGDGVKDQLDPADTDPCKPNAKSAACAPAVKPPATVKALRGPRRITLVWNNVKGAEKYNIYVSRQPNIVIGAAGVTRHTKQTPPFRLTNLTPGERYYFAITTVANGKESALSQEVSNYAAGDTAPPPTAGTGKLNDTGITWGGNYPSGNNTSCVGETIAQQDCSHGRDATANDDSDGHAGFSFTKLGSDGKPLAIQNAAWDDNGSEAAGTRWACVKDNVTGLIWEVKTNDGGLHDRDDTYTWYNTDPATNGGKPGYARRSDYDSSVSDNTCHGYDANDPASYCNTQAYVARVNARGLCGARDWRLPTVEELRSIVSYDRYNPAIDKRYLPNTQSYAFGYWSSSPVANYDVGAWVVDFFYGYDNKPFRGGNLYVRLVRGGQ